MAIRLLIFSNYPNFQSPLFLTIYFFVFCVNFSHSTEFQDFSDFDQSNKPGHVLNFINHYEPVITLGINWTAKNTLVYKFRAFGRVFGLNLKSGSPLLASKALVVTHDKNHTQIIPAKYFLKRLVTGTVSGQYRSYVTGQVRKGQFEGVINLINETYYVEPTKTYFPHLDETFPTKTVVFRLSDINMTKLMCGVANICQPFRAGSISGPEYTPDMEIGKIMTVPESPPGTLNRKLSVSRRKQTSDDKQKICTVKLVADHTFYQKATDRTIEMTIHEMMVLITIADGIFRGTDFDHDGKSDGIGFQVSSVVIWKSKHDANYKLYKEKLTSEDFLSAFSLHDSSDVCLAVCLVHRVFPGNVLGLAYTASVKHNHAGGICQRRISSRPPRSYNTAVVTVEGSTGRLPRALNGLTLTHELGHSFGSDHDPKTDLCSPSGNRGGPYLMADTIENSNLVNNNKFSPCSLRSMARLLPVKGKCLLAHNDLGDFICGNTIRESGEECDCGVRAQCEETDACCVPKGGLGQETECTLTKKAQCSPRNGPCCKADCTLVSASVKLLCSETECTENVMCDGLTAECPPAKPKPDGTPCNDDSGICMSANCTDKTCARSRLKECTCSGWKYGCDICCLVNELCLPVSQLGILTSKGGKAVRRNGEKCNQELGVCEDGLCKPYDRLFDDILEGGEKDSESTDEEARLTLMATLLGVTIVVIVVTIALLLLYFFTPLGEWMPK